MSLTPKRRKFVEEYLKDFNGTQAAIRAGYAENSARQTAYRLLTNDYILAEIESSIMSENEILGRIAAIAKSAEKDSDKLRALELLGKTLALFTDKVQIEEIMGLEVVVDDEESDTPSAPSS